MSPEIAVALIAQAGAIVIVLLSQGRKINRIETNSSITREQTENDHSESEFPNLREEITETRNMIKGVVRQLGGLEQWVRDLAVGYDRLDGSINRKAQITTREVNDFKEEREERLRIMLSQEIPALIDRRISDHLRRHSQEP